MILHYPSKRIERSHHDKDNSDKFQGRNSPSDTKKFFCPCKRAYEFIRLTGVFENQDPETNNHKTNKEIHKKGLETFIADTSHSNEDIVPHFMTDIFDMCIDSTVIEKIRIPHNLMHEIITRDDFTSTIENIGEYLKFRFCQDNILLSSDNPEL